MRLSEGLKKKPIESLTAVKPEGGWGHSVFRWVKMWSISDKDC